MNLIKDNDGSYSVCCGNCIYMSEENLLGDENDDCDYRCKKAGRYIPEVKERPEWCPLEAAELLGWAAALHLEKRTDEWWAKGGFDAPTEEGE